MICHTIQYMMHDMFYKLTSMAMMVELQTKRQYSFFLKLPAANTRNLFKGVFTCPLIFLMELKGTIMEKTNSAVPFSVVLIEITEVK